MPEKIFFLFCISTIFAITIPVQKGWCQQHDNIYLFSYFKNNGEDGLHLAWSRDGLNWTALNGDSSLLKPVVGKEKLMRDPCIITGQDGYFYMVWTASWQDKGIGYARSKDLIHWSEQQFIPVMEKEPEALNCWAPEITYDREKKQYLIYWATSIPGRYPVTDKTGDGKYNHRIYYVTTKDFTRFSKPQLLYDKGFSVIDATIVPGQSEYIMVMKDETRWPPQKNLRIATAKNATGPYTAPSSPITDTSYWAEGPTVTRINTNWVIYFDKYTQHKYGAIQSADLKNWKDISDQIHLPSGIRHGTIFIIPAKQWESLQTLPGLKPQ